MEGVGEHVLLQQLACPFPQARREYEQAQDLQNARRVYLDLIQNTPTSPYVPNAYLAFAKISTLFHPPAVAAGLHFDAVEHLEADLRLLIRLREIFAQGEPHGT